MNLNKLKALHEKYRDWNKKIGEEKRKAEEYVLNFLEHKNRTYPYSEEDEEGVMVFLAPKDVLMKFKGITVNEGYEKTVNKFKYIQNVHKVDITIEGEQVRVKF